MNPGSRVAAALGNRQFALKHRVGPIYEDGSFGARVSGKSMTWDPELRRLRPSRSVQTPPRGSGIGGSAGFRAGRK